MNHTRQVKSSTAVLLAKATSQLKGNRVKTETETEQDDVKKYISSLANKISKRTPSASFDAEEDISISNEDHEIRMTNATLAPITSKFIKRKPLNSSSIINNGNVDQSNKSQTFHRDFHQRNRKTSRTALSSVSFSDLDTESGTDQPGLRDYTNNPERLQFENDGSKFIKTVKPKVKDEQHGVKEKVALHKKAATVFALSSDEESLAEFIEHLDHESHDFSTTNRLKSPVSPDSSSHNIQGNVVLDLSALQPAISTDKKGDHTKPSPFYKNDTRTVDHLDNVPHNIGTKSHTKSPFYKGDDNQKSTKNTEKNSNDSRVNFLQSSKSPFFKDDGIPLSTKTKHKNSNDSRVNFLQSSESPFFKDDGILLSTKTKHKNSNDTRVFQSSKSPFFTTSTDSNSKTAFLTKDKYHQQTPKSGSNRKSPETKPSAVSNIFGAFGLQTVEDLIGGDGYHSDIQSIAEDRQQTLAWNRSISEVKSVTEQLNSYSQDFDESVTEHIPSTRCEFENDKTEAEHSRSDHSTSSSQHTTSSVSTHTQYVDRPKERDTLQHVDQLQVGDTIHTRSIQVQTDNHPRVAPTIGLDTVNHSPIATYVVSSAAIEALTTYTPATIALHNMLKDQLHLTSQFVQSQQNIYDMHTQRLHDSHNYTTLDDTKQFIEANRTPRLTFEEALKMVSLDYL